MLPILVGLIAAMLFGIGSYSLLGLDALIEYPWIESVFWGLIGAGIAMAGLDLIRCKMCEISKLFNKSVRLCHSESCSRAQIV